MHTVTGAPRAPSGTAHTAPKTVEKHCLSSEVRSGLTETVLCCTKNFLQVGRCCSSIMRFYMSLGLCLIGVRAHENDKGTCWSMIFVVAGHGNKHKVTLNKL